MAYNLPIRAGHLGPESLRIDSVDEALGYEYVEEEAGLNGMRWP